MPLTDTMEATGTIVGIIKETGTTKNLQTPGDVDITYVSGGSVVTVAFLGLATSYSEDSSKTINKQDIVGTQIQKITEGSLDDTLSYDALSIEPAALGDDTVEFTTGTVHGLNAATNSQYLVSTRGLSAMFRSSNTYTIRVWHGCELDVNGDADISTAKEVVDLEKVHISANNQSTSGGGDSTVSVSFDAERVSFPAAYNSAPA